MNIPTQLSVGDIAVLNSIRNVVSQLGPYVYMEIGSYLGGSLYPHLRDSNCVSAISVDTRLTTPIQDERDIDYSYSQSTQDMLDLLHANNIPTDKLMTVDGTIMSVPVSPVDLIFIDGEHTNTAVFRDAVAALRFNPGCIVFHDDWIVYSGIQEFMDLLEQDGHTADVYKFPNSDVTAIVFPALQEPMQNFMQGCSLDWLEFVEIAQGRLKGTKNDSSR